MGIGTTRPNLLKIYSGYFVVANFFAGKGVCITGATCGDNLTQAEPESNGGMVYLFAFLLFHIGYHTDANTNLCCLPFPLARFSIVGFTCKSSAKVKRSFS